MAEPMLVEIHKAKLRPQLSDVNDGLLGELIQTASRIAETECNRTFSIATGQQEKYNGRGERELIVRNYPIVKFTSLIVVDQDGSSTTYNGDFFDIDMDAGLIKFKPSKSGCLSTGFQNVTLTYDYGYTEIPSNLQDAVIQIVISLHSRVSVDPRLKKEKIGEYSYELSEFAHATELINPTARALLAPYVDEKMGQ